VLEVVVLGALVPLLISVVRHQKGKREDEAKRRLESEKTHKHMCDKLDVVAKAILERDELGKLTESTKDKLRQIVAKELE
jgi:hypothetical protein